MKFILYKTHYSGRQDLKLLARVTRGCFTLVLNPRLTRTSRIPAVNALPERIVPLAEVVRPVMQHAALSAVLLLKAVTAQPAVGDRTASLGVYSQESVSTHCVRNYLLMPS